MMSVHFDLRPTARSGPNFLDWLFGAALSDYHRRAGARPWAPSGDPEEVPLRMGPNLFLRAEKNASILFFFPPVHEGLAHDFDPGPVQFQNFQIHHYKS